MVLCRAQQPEKPLTVTSAALVVIPSETSFGRSRLRIYPSSVLGGHVVKTPTPYNPTKPNHDRSCIPVFTMKPLLMPRAWSGKSLPGAFIVRLHLERYPSPRVLAFHGIGLSTRLVLPKLYLHRIRHSTQHRLPNNNLGSLGIRFSEEGTAPKPPAPRSPIFWRSLIRIFGLRNRNAETVGGSALCSVLLCLRRRAESSCTDRNPISTPAEWVWVGHGR